MSERQREYDELFRKILARMNSGRHQPIPPSDHSLIWETCAEVVDLRYQERARERS